MKYLTLLLIVLLLSCSTDNKSEESKQEENAENLEKDTTKTYAKGGRLDFSNYNWIVRSSNYADRPGFCASDEKNVFLNKENNLILNYDLIDDEWLGSEINTRQKFSSGFFKLTFLADFSEMHKYLSLSFSTINSVAGIVEGVAQLGVRFAYQDEKDETPLEFYMYTTNSKIEELYSSNIGKDILSDTLTVIYGMSNNEIIFSCYKGSSINDSNLLDKVKLSEYTHNENTMPDEMKFAKTAELQRPIIHLCINDAFAETIEKPFQIKIIDFEFIAPTKEVALKVK
jgi:hypothetical protein